VIEGKDAEEAEGRKVKVASVIVEIYSNKIDFYSLCVI